MCHPPNSSSEQYGEESSKELKAMYLPCKEIVALYRDQTVVITRDDTTLGACIKGGRYGIRQHCVLLCRVLFWYNLRNMCLKLRHIPGFPSVKADKLFFHKLVVIECSLSRDFQIGYATCGFVHKYSVLQF